MARQKFDPISYKKRNIQIWNEIAPKYHKRWASTNHGPFESTSHLVKLAKIKENDSVLDLACGSGVVLKEIFSSCKNVGQVLGVDSSITAIKIAKKENKQKKLELLIADSELLHFKTKFDVVTCQYALFFFPNSQKALRNVRKSLKKGGSLAISVHAKNIPFFDCILKAVTSFIPDYVPPGAPNLERFGTKKSLKDEVSKAGFSKIKLHEFTFTYTAESFDSYWCNYLRYIAKPLKEKLKTLSKKEFVQLKQTVKNNTIPFIQKNGTIKFPWRVLILTCKY